MAMNDKYLLNVGEREMEVTLSGLGVLFDMQGYDLERIVEKLNVGESYEYKGYKLTKHIPTNQQEEFLMEQAKKQAKKEAWDKHVEEVVGKEKYRNFLKEFQENNKEEYEKLQQEQKEYEETKEELKLDLDIDSIINNAIDNAINNIDMDKVFGGDNDE